MIPRSMVTGKLDGAWRVVARSLPRRLLVVPDGFSRRLAQERGLQSGAKNFAHRADYNEIDWSYKAC